MAIIPKKFTKGQMQADFNSAAGKTRAARYQGKKVVPAVNPNAPQAVKDQAMLDWAAYLSKESVFNFGGNGKSAATADQIKKSMAGLSGNDLQDALVADLGDSFEAGKAFTKETIDEAAKKLTGEYDKDGKMVLDDVSVKGTPIKGSGFERNVSSAWEHQPHAAYATLTSERTTTSYQDQQNFPISGEKKELRKYSPFTISLIPPKEVTHPNPNTPTSSNKDPYSWSSLGELANAKKIKDAMTVPKEDKRYFSSAFTGDGERLGKRSTNAKNLETALSELSMLVYEGSISNQTLHHINGRDYESNNVTPLLSVANVADIYHQLINMFRTPPLVLLINPMSMNVTYSKIQAHQERTRYGYIFQAWGEQLPVINFSGRIGAYVSTESDSGRRKFMSVEKTTHPSGVQESSRHMSPAYQNLMNLMKIYKNNGYIRDTIGGSQANHLIGAVEIAYDGVRYIGHFDKLEYTFEEAGNLGGVNFSFDFTATEIRRDDSERMQYVTKMRNPNEGARFGDGGMDSTYQTMSQYRQARNRAGEEGNSWYSVANNDFADEDPNTPGYQNSVTASWNDQLDMPDVKWDEWPPKVTSDGGSGWGTGGFQRSRQPDTDPELSDFQGYNDPDDDR